MKSRLIVYIDMDGVLTDYSNFYRQKLSELPSMPYPQSQFGFFSSIPTIPNAVESVKTLIDDDLIDPYILTAPSIRNPMCYAEKRIWVENHFGLPFTDRLIITRHKNLLRGNVLIDDQVTGRGQDRFDGLLIQFGSSKYPCWQTVIERLYQLKEQV